MAGYAEPTKTAIDKDTSFAGQCSEMQNDAGTDVSDWHKADTTETRFVLSDDRPKENAANLAGSNGANDLGKRGVSPENNTPSCDQFASEFPALATKYGDDLQERVQHALDALADLEPWQVEMVAAKHLGSAGSPLPEFLGGMDDARFWASLATPKEVDAYAAACFEVMPTYRQAAFASFASGNGRAAA